MVVDYIDTHRDRIVEGRALGVEPICRVLRDAGVQIAPSTYYAAKQHTPSARALRDQELTKEILTCTPRIWASMVRGRSMPSLSAPAIEWLAARWSG